ncbi:conserved hypothetical protein [Rhodopseudomonas palustris TIE-1]|uniref:hypothetical protein n=1 Tax=Rhodopseudomonas palustris TaxID=1076 RepID=UPI000164A54A|nr:hypothetical protein [Rhodopseudomonas palustris]ACF01588.1 conserved hypothetical protein [Rhodopseudomonas palustris TIE-1]
MSWTKRFDPPIELPGGGALTTLREAAAYIEALPAAEQKHPEVQTAIHVLLQAADHDGPMTFARMGVLRMLSRHAPPPEPRPAKRRQR